jgi:Zinc carboxypeptidase
MRAPKFIVTSSLIVALWAVPAASRESITSPREQFGFDIGADYALVNYTGLLAYWQKLDRESERIVVSRIGVTAEGRPMIVAVITSPANHRKIARYRMLSRRLALAEGLSETEALALAREARAVVQIDGGLHATEILGSQQLIELVYQMASRDDPETRRILDDVILLAIPSNPDGLELVADWYMREEEPARRSMRFLPRLYQKYAGHDNNRDFYMITQPETEAVSRVMYHEWFPQIVYNCHQTGPAGTVLFCSPFRDPFNYVFDPLVPLGVELVGAAMHTRFAAEGKAGATMRSGAPYSTWWSGGLRSTAYFHNMIGILTETIGSPTPINIPFVPETQLPKNDLPLPIAPQAWHMRQSVDYSITADRAILDLAARLREELLMNAFRMGRNAIDKGSRDSWTVTPADLERVTAALKKDDVKPEGRGQGYPPKYLEVLRDPAARDPRGYILTRDQPDFGTATKFVNALIKSGVTVHRAARAFEAAGRSYPEGSYAVRCAQAFRPHILAMFEPQHHPHDVPYPGGPPIAPYDSAGWTLAYQMGVTFDRLLDAFDGPFEKINGPARVPEGRVAAGANPAGFFLDHRVNDAFIAVNRLLKAGQDVYWTQEPLAAGGEEWPAGTVYVPADPAARDILQDAAGPLGLRVQGTDTTPSVAALKLRPVRLGLWDAYGGSGASGWARWVLEQFEFPYEVVFAQTLDAGSLGSKFDALIFVAGAVPLRDRETREERRPGGAPKPDDVPESYRSQLGAVTVAKTVPELRRFLEAGGTILAVGSSTSLGFHSGLSISDALVEKSPDGTEARLTREKYYVPGSILEARADTASPLAYGLAERTDFFFDNSPAFAIKPEGLLSGVRPVAWFDGPAPLRSGWAWGQSYLNQAVAVIDAPVGRGRLFLYGPDILFRGQSHGTFKLLFNGIYYGPALPVRLGPSGASDK